MITDEQKRFLRGLEKLTRETGVRIGSCGCCDSMWLVDAVITSDKSGYCADSNGESVRWVDKSDEDDWQTYGHEIVK